MGLAVRGRDVGDSADLVEKGELLIAMIRERFLMRTQSAEKILPRSYQQKNNNANRRNEE